MKLTRIKCTHLSRAKNIVITDDRIIGLTGKKAVILDVTLNLIHEIQGLEYVYSGRVSPDRKKLLLISNANKFYLIDLVSFEMTRVTVKFPYNYNLGGAGCWSLDGRWIYIPVQNSKTLNSTLRCYDAENLSLYYDIMPEKYCLTGIVAIDKYKKYLLTGFDRDQNNKHVLIHFDGESFLEYPLPARRGDVVSNMEFDSRNDEVLIYGFVCKRYKMDGSFMGVIPHIKPKHGMISFGDVMRSTGIEHLEAYQQFLKQGNECELPTLDTINKFGFSKAGDAIYLASESGFYVLEPNSNEVVAEIREEYGVKSYIELGDKILALSTVDSVKLFRLKKDPEEATYTINQQNF